MIKEVKFIIFFFSIWNRFFILLKVKFWEYIEEFKFFINRLVLSIEDDIERI